MTPDTPLSEERFTEALNLVAVADSRYETPQSVDAYDAVLASHRALASRVAELEKVDAGQSYDRGYKQGLEDGHRCEQRHAHIDQLERQLADAQARADKAIKDYYETAGFMFEACDQLTALKQQHAALRERATTLFEAIKHGDAKHQEWLRNAITEHFRKALATGAGTDK